MSKVALYGAFTKVEEQDDGSLHVEGVASSESRDASKELVRADGMRKALPGYLKWGTVREMHQPIAAGTALSAEVRDDGKTYFAAKVVDAGSIAKVKADVLKGFSIGGRVTKRNPDDKSIIEELELTEISLVDRPCNPDAAITLWKVDSMPDPVTPPAASTTPPVDPPQPAAPPKATAVPTTGDAAPSTKAAEAAAPASPASATTEPAKPEGTVAAPAGEPVKKGMYQVQWAAELCDSLASLAASAQYEAEYEGDGSTVPAQLKAACAALCEALRALVQEETAELMGAGSTIEAAAQPGALKKSEKVAAIAKAFLGTPAPAPATTITVTGMDAGAFRKFVESDAYRDAVAKALATPTSAADAVAKVQSERDDLDKALGTANDALKKVLAERDDLSKALATANAELARKGVLRVVPVSKVDDQGGSTTDPAPAPTDALGLIKKVHREGAMPALFTTPPRR